MHAGPDPSSSVHAGAYRHWQVLDQGCTFGCANQLDAAADAKDSAYGLYRRHDIEADHYDHELIKGFGTIWFRHDKEKDLHPAPPVINKPSNSLQRHLCFAS
jgi:hypothetical protein